MWARGTGQASGQPGPLTALLPLLAAAAVTGAAAAAGRVRVEAATGGGSRMRNATHVLRELQAVKMQEPCERCPHVAKINSSSAEKGVACARRVKFCNALCWLC